MTGRGFLSQSSVDIFVKNLLQVSEITRRGQQETPLAHTWLPWFQFLSFAHTLKVHSYSIEVTTVTNTTSFDLFTALMLPSSTFGLGKYFPKMLNSLHRRMFSFSLRINCSANQMNLAMFSLMKFLWIILNSEQEFATLFNIFWH